MFKKKKERVCVLFKHLHFQSKIFYFNYLFMAVFGIKQRALERKISPPPLPSSFCTALRLSWLELYTPTGMKEYK